MNLMIQCTYFFVSWIIELVELFLDSLLFMFQVLRFLYVVHSVSKNDPLNFVPVTPFLNVP